MKKTLLTIVAACVAVMLSAAPDTNAVNALIRRIAPAAADRFVTVVLPDKGADYFELSSRDGKIIVAGNNQNSIAVGFNHYLKYYCHTDVSWYAGDAVCVPSQLPQIEGKVSIDSRCDNRFFLNYCTYGYTMPWWRWSDWERLIDWMALNGVTMPLAITGQETIWYNVWTKLGLTDTEVRTYFTGPAHLPWHRMSNIDRWQGPLPQSWLESQAELQKQIVKRERELGMTPVLPAFAGHVPAELQRLYPQAKITKLHTWAGFPADYACSFLDPMDPLYTKIQKLYLDEQKRAYGTDHIYGVDIFNELVPPSWEPDYLAGVSKRVYSSLRAADPKAVWLQMGWLFYFMRANWTNERIEAYLTAVPQDKQIILDYWAEYKEIWTMTDSFFGTPFLWCYLGNFGGNPYLNGELQKVNQRVENTFDKAGKNFVGIGSTLEGFDLNPFMFNYIFEKAWNFDTHKDVNRWVEALADSRVGRVDADARRAWQMLIDSVYQSPSYGSCSPHIFDRPGKLGGFKYNAATERDCRNLATILSLLAKVDSDTPAYRFDVMNLTREYLINRFAMMYNDYEKACVAKNLDGMLNGEAQMMNLIADLDLLLACDPTMLTGKWIADARSFGRDAAEADYYESNARCLITTWGDKSMGLNDYARRTWSGLVGSFYAQRWQMYFAAVKRAVVSGGEFDDAAYDGYKKEVTSFEKLWWEQRVGSFSATPVGDATAVASGLLDKYKLR